MTAPVDCPGADLAGSRGSALAGLAPRPPEAPAPERGAARAGLAPRPPEAPAPERGAARAGLAPGPSEARVVEVPEPLGEGLEAPAPDEGEPA